MKVYLNNYRHHWLSPYTIIDYLFFWTDWSHCHLPKKNEWDTDENNATACN